MEPDEQPNLPERELVHRQSERKPFGAEAVIRNNRYNRIGGRLIDISEHGCKIDLFSGSAEPGNFVTIKLDGMESWAGEVRWAEDSIVGVQFQRPLHPAIVEHLSQSQPEVALAAG
ncbi:PilZ domain-containing protein [Novosphingobium sp. ZN18A2]|uniref:PilZ domain-containing protein n=1 Tax=Novosphingobium sp. ZN18A2 TaxID=3079861 RepID=UPI0030CF8A98